MAGMKKIKRAVASVGSYTTPGGETKRRYLTVGHLFKREDGSISMKMESMPVGNEWEGWINFYDIETDAQREKRMGQKAQPAAAAPAPEFDDDIPF
jgi:hypothetical protein